MVQQFELLPALDISIGKAIRPEQGNLPDTPTQSNPADIIGGFLAAGSSWIHIVDLDQAFGTGTNQKLIQNLISSARGTHFQISGGIKDQNSFDSALSSGAHRINLASQALHDMSFVERVLSTNAYHVAFALDVEEGQVKPRGTSDGFGPWVDVVRQLERFGVKTINVTDVSRDGMMSGPNLDLVKEVAQVTSARVFSSGGVSSLSDLEKLIGLEECSGVILGKALYSGAVELSEALELVAHGR